MGPINGHGHGHGHGLTINITSYQKKLFVSMSNLFTDSLVSEKK